MYEKGVSRNVAITTSSTPPFRAPAVTSASPCGRVGGKRPVSASSPQLMQHVARRAVAAEVSWQFGACRGCRSLQNRRGQAAGKQGAIVACVLDLCAHDLGCGAFEPAAASL